MERFFARALGALLEPEAFVEMEKKVNLRVMRQMGEEHPLLDCL